MANSSKGNNTIIDRYSKALLELSKEQEALDEVQKEIIQVKSILDNNKDFSRTLESPVLSRNQQRIIVSKVFEKTSISELVSNFFTVVCLNRRSNLISKICEHFIEMYLKSMGVLKAEIISSELLEKKELKILENKIEESSGSKINLITTVDPSILGGYILKIGSLMLDGSVRSKLQGIKASTRKG